MEPTKIINTLIVILANADYKAQHKFLKIIEHLLKKEGFNYVIESWGDDFPWMKSFKP